MNDGKNGNDGGKNGGATGVGVNDGKNGNDGGKNGGATGVGATGALVKHSPNCVE